MHLKYILITTLAINLSNVASARADVAVSPFFSSLQEFLAPLQAECESFGNGVFDRRDGAVTYVADFNQDGVTDPILDNDYLECSTSATLFTGGSGGGYLTVFISQNDGSYQSHEFLAQNYSVVFQGKIAILLLKQHGTNCDQSGPDTCFAAHNWKD